MAAAVKSTKEEVQKLKLVKKFSDPKATKAKAAKTTKKPTKTFIADKTKSLIELKNNALKAGDKALARKIRRQIRKLNS